MKKLLKYKQDADKIVNFIRQGTEDIKLKKILLWNYIKRCNLQ